MDPQQVQALVGSYYNKLKKLDSQAKQLTAGQQKEYAERKNRFIAQIRSWQKASQREYEQLESNLEQSFNELESTWYSP